MSQNSVFAGSLDKLIKSRPSSIGYLDSISELKAGTNLTSNCLTITATAPQNPKITGIEEKDISYTSDNAQKKYDLPHMPPWFGYIGSRKLYQALSGILRLVGLSLMTGHFNSSIKLFGFNLQFMSLLLFTDIRLFHVSF